MEARIELTEFEQFVWDNRDRQFNAIASDTNRSERAVWSAYERAKNKLSDLRQEEIQSAIYRGEIEATDAEGCTTMRDLA